MGTPGKSEMPATIIGHMTGGRFMENYTLAKIDENSPEYQEAMDIHHRILANGTIAATAMMDLCKYLKQMRDQHAYIHLGYESFDDYCETAANIKKRQAYNHISTYEKLGPEVLQSNAKLGITKLGLLAQIPEADREEILSKGQAEDLSTREMTRLRDELTKAREQLSFLQAEIQAEENETPSIADIAEARDRYMQEASDLQARLKKLESDNATAAKAVEAEAKKKAKEQADKEIAKIKAEAEKTAQIAREAGIKAGREAAEKGLQAIEKERADALTRAQELEKKLKVHGNQDTVLFSILFDDLQNQFNKIISCLSNISSADKDAGEKYRAALKKLMSLMDQKI